MMMTLYEVEIASPVGLLHCMLHEKAVCYLGLVPPANAWLNKWYPERSCVSAPESLEMLRRLRSQLVEYFEHQRKEFDLPLEVRETEYRRRVYTALLEIPYAQTLSYGELAKKLGSGPRAVGQANHHNPVSILIPCHRVIGADGGLTGYGGGMERKSGLLELESKGMSAHGH